MQAHCGVRSLGDAPRALKRVTGLRGRRIGVHAAILGCGVAMCALAVAVADGILFQRLPFPNAERLIWIGTPASAQHVSGLSQSQYDVLDRRMRSKASLAPYRRASLTLRTEEVTGGERIQIAEVGGQFFRVLGIQPWLGRALTDSDDVQGSELVVVISENLWRRVFASDPRVIGRIVRLDERPSRVVGVLAAKTGFPSNETDVWMPLGATSGPMLWSTDAPMLSVIGRVPDAGTSTRAALHLLREELRQLPRPRVTTGKILGVYLAEPLLDHLIGGMRPAVIALALAAAFLMAIACLAAATIQLAGNGARERDVAIRTVLGASPARLWREVGGEVVVTAVLTALTGIVLSWSAMHVGRGVGLAVVPELAAVHLNGTVLLAASGVAAVCALVVTAIPLLTIVRPDIERSLRGSAHTVSATKGSAKFRDLLIAIAVGATLMLVLASIVAADTVIRLLRIDTGFAARDVFSVTVRLPYQYVTPIESEKIRAFTRALRDELRPGLQNAPIAVTTDVPAKGTRSVVSVQSTDDAAEHRELRAGMSQVSGDYFALVHIPLSRGRTFDASDNERTQPVVIVDTDIAKRLYGGANAVGQQLRLADLSLTAQVVGVVSAVRQTGRLTEPLPQVYLPFDQLPLSTLTILVSGKGSVADYRRIIASAIHHAAPGAAMISSAPLEDEIYEEVRKPQFYAMALSLFALVAMLVSAAAVYASVAALVAQRTREIGIRIALGASSARITSLVMGRVATMMAVGTLAGMIGAQLLWQILEKFGFTFGEPTLSAFVWTTVTLWCAGALAVALPVGRATRISPLIALKE